MNILPALLGLLLPACAGQGATGIPVPAPGSLEHLQRPTSPNTALAGPAEYRPAPDIVLPVYEVPASELYAAIQRVGDAEPRTYSLARFDDRMEAHWVARSSLLNFPDLVAAQVSPHGEGRSTLVLYMRSVYGYSDLGANRARLAAWLAALRLPSRS